MEIILQEISAATITDVNQCDGVFTIEAKLVLHVENDEIRTTIVAVPPTQKRYNTIEMDYLAYVDNPTKVIFLAYVAGAIAGQIILRKNWNRYVYVEDISVDVAFRQRGIGQALMAKAEQWAKQRHLVGLMLETQNNNVRACRFYEKYGFQLRGFDSFLYKGFNRETDEIALYWYLTFED